MNIRMLVDYETPTHKFRQGRSYDVSDSQGTILIREGAAESVNETSTIKGREKPGESAEETRRKRK